MRRIMLFTVVFISLIAFGFIGGYYYIFEQQAGRTVPLAIYSNGTDIAVVLSRLDRLLCGADISFMYRRDGEPWYGYYLAHESGFWTNTELKCSNGMIQVFCENKLFAIFDIKAKTFKHILQGITYSRKSGIMGGKRVLKFSGALGTDCYRPN